MKTILIVLLLSVSLFGNKIFIEGIDNQFLCDGKQSSGGGFQSCSKITALKPMTLCISQSSGIKCQKLKPNETINSTETKPPVVENNPQKNLLVKRVKNVTINTDMDLKNNIRSQGINSSQNSIGGIQISKLMNFNSIGQTSAGLGGFANLSIYGYMLGEADGFIDTRTTIIIDELDTLANLYSYENSSNTLVLFPLPSYSSSSSSSEVLVDLTNQLEPASQFYTLNDIYETNTPTYINDGSAWGYWYVEYTNFPSAGKIEQPWVSGNVVIPDQIENLSQREALQTYTFTGAVLGNVLTNSNTLENIYFDDTHTNELLMNFHLGGGSKSMDGTLKFETASTYWDLFINSNSVTLGAQSFNGSFSSTANTTLASSSFEGRYYGPYSYIQSLGGKFEVTDNLNNSAFGVFKATNMDFPIYFYEIIQGYRYTSLNNKEEFQYEYSYNYDVDDISYFMEYKMDWGYWVDNQAGDPNSSNLPWVGGVLTDTTVLDNLMDINSASNTYRFEGQVKGNVLTSTNTIEAIIEDNTNSLEMNFDLGGGINSMSGQIAFQTTSTSWNGDLSSSHNQISNNGFNGDISHANGTSGSFEGKFYGEDSLKGVGGNFNMTNSIGEKASGVFKAEQ